MDPFEQSADMRLLELRRTALGKEPPPPTDWSSAQRDSHEGIILEEPVPPVLQGGRVTVDLSATPNARLIPGAVVTLALSIQNTSEQTVQDVRAGVNLPAQSSYRTGSLLGDQRPLRDEVAEAFFAEGYTIKRLAAGQQVGFSWKISVEAGTAPLVVSPHVRATDAAVIGASAIRLTRGAAAKSSRLPQSYLPAAPLAETPFYELDADEERIFSREAEGEAPVGFHEAPLVVMPDIAREEPPPPVTQTEPRLYSGFDSASLATVKKLFAAESFAQIPHYILQNGLACSLAPGGRDLGIRTHLSAQAGMLSRALLMRKLGKPMRVADFSTGKTDFDLSSMKEPAAGPPPSHLYAPLGAAEIEFCAPVEQRNQLESFIRIRQLAVALQARHVISGDAELKSRIESLLESYAKLARASINRTFIRAKLDRNFDPFGTVDAAADETAHQLIDALGLLLEA